MTTTDPAEVLTALADPTRRLVLELLAQEPCTVGELAARLPVSRPAVSQHLKVLKEVGLVADEAQGTRRRYSVAPEGVQALRDYAEQLWRTALGSFAATARADAGPPAPPSD
ncbi:MAG: metalloregulator ArsR/SmtB family transcription factor [Kineosporiaceae bacterium]